MFADSVMDRTLVSRLARPYFPHCVFTPASPPQASLTALPRASFGTRALNLPLRRAARRSDFAQYLVGASQAEQITQRPREATSTRGSETVTRHRQRARSRGERSAAEASRRSAVAAAGQRQFRLDRRCKRTPISPRGLPARLFGHSACSWHVI